MEKTKFDEWYSKHKPVCEADYEDSSGCMEVVGFFYSTLWL